MHYYEYYKDLCVCDGKEVYLPMRSRDGTQVYDFPVVVFNVNNVALGIAEDKSEYIAIWNSDNANRQRGVLTGLVGPFSFTLIQKEGEVAPPWVIGDLCNIIVDFEGRGITDIDGNDLGGLCGESDVNPVVIAFSPNDFSTTINNFL